MSGGPRRVLCLAAAAAALSASPAPADMLSMEGVEPWDICGGCHGLDGAGNALRFPRIGGQPAGYILKQLEDFRAGRRDNDGGAMAPNVADLAEADLGRVAEWFAAQDPPPPEPPELAAEAAALAAGLIRDGRPGVPACASCHGSAGTTEPMPRIAGQHARYIAKQLQDFRAGARANDPDGSMRVAVRGLADAEIEALAAYLSRAAGLD